MNTIWKFPLEVTDSQLVNIPEGAKILTVQTQQGIVTLWAVIDPSKDPDTLEVRILGTGNPADNIEDMFYIGTVQERIFVWHVFGKWVK